MNRLYTWNFLIAFLAQTAFTTTNSLLAHYSRWVEFLGGDVATVGTVSAVSALVGLVLRPTIAPWIDRLGPRFCWCVASVVVMLASLGNLCISEVGPALYVLRSIMSIGIAVVFASGLTYIALVTPVERRAEAIGVLGAGGFAGLLIGPSLGDLFLSEGVRTYDDFVWYFWACIVGVGISMILVLSNKRAPNHSQHSPGWHPIAFLRTVRMYWPGAIMAVTLAFGACMTVPFVFLANYADQLPDSDLGPFFTVYASVGLIVRLGLRSWPDQFGPKRVMMAGMALFALGNWTFLFASPAQAWWILVAGGICGAAHGLTFHSMVALVLHPFPPEHRGTGSTLALMGLDIGTFLSAQSLGLLIERFGFQALFHTVSLCCLASIAIFAWSEFRKGSGPTPDESPIDHDQISEAADALADVVPRTQWTSRSA